MQTRRFGQSWDEYVCLDVRTYAFIYKPISGELAFTSRLFPLPPPIMDSQFYSYGKMSSLLGQVAKFYSMEVIWRPYGEVQLMGGII